MEQDSTVAVTVRKLVLISLMEIFKDLAPSYKIRPLTEEEKTARVRLFFSFFFLCEKKVINGNIFLWIHMKLLKGLFQNLLRM